MSTADQLLLFLHVGFAIFALGPLTAAIMSTPRYIRQGNVTVLRYLNRITRLYGMLALGVFLFGLFLSRGRFAEAWLSASMTLFLVSLVLLLLVERDQRKAAHLLEAAAAGDAAAGEAQAGAQEKTAAARQEGAQVERGRIAAISGVIGLLWVVTLLLMIWYG